MAPFKVEATLPALAPSYFLERDSAAFRALLAKTLKIGQLECAGVWREGMSTYVRIITKPEFGSWVPKSVASQLQSSNLEFHDIIEYNPAHISSPPYTMHVRTESPFLGDKLDVRMTLTVEEAEGGAACRQVLEGHIRVKMFGVGRIIEGIVKDSLHNTYKKLPEIVRRWQLFREEALRRGDSRQLLLGRPPVGCEVSWIRREVLQILQEPLPEDGHLSPISSLCPVVGASEEDSEDSPSALARTQRRIQAHLSAAAEVAGGAALGAAEAAAEAANVGAVAVADVLPGPSPSRRPVSGSISTVSVYYDAREDGPLEGGSPEAEASSGDAAAHAAAQQQQQQQQQQEPGSPWASFEPSPARAAGQQGAPPPPPPPSQSPPGTAELAAAALARGARHRRHISSDSATSGADTPLGEDGQPVPRQPGSRRFWRRFNLDYDAWAVYWEEVGVEQEEEEEAQEEGGSAGGVVGGALRAVEGLLRDSYYSTSILVALFLLRHGWLRVEPDRDADPHDESSRQHGHHRHARSSSSGGGGGLPPGEHHPRHARSRSSGLPAGDAWLVRGSSDVSGSPALRGRPPLPRSSSGGHLSTHLDACQAAQPQSLARVSQEVFSRLVTGSRAVAAAPVRAVVAAGSSVRQASMSGARAISRVHRPRGDAGSGSGSGSGGESPVGRLRGSAAAAAAPLPADAVARLATARHSKTMSLDAGTAAAAQQAAAEAALAGRPRRGASPTKELQRRPSNLAEERALASMQRAESRVRAPSRLACFSVCGRSPAVKD